MTPRRTRRGEQRRFGTGDGRFVEIHRGRLEAVGRLEDVVGAVTFARAERVQRLGVCRDRPARREITAGRRDVRAAGARQQRPEQQHRSSQPADQRSIGFVAY